MLLCVMWMWRIELVSVVMCSIVVFCVILMLLVVVVMVVCVVVGLVIVSGDVVIRVRMMVLWLFIDFFLWLMLVGFYGCFVLVWLFM